MSIIIFIVVLIILIFVHELGHFLVSKACGIRVDEFGLGFPPRIFGVKYGETTYSINWIPFGGFVKIFGEDPSEESISGPSASRSLVNKPKWMQVLVLIAGVSFNVIFAWLLISFGFMSGLPTSTSAYPDVNFTDAKVVITNVLPGSPADKALLKSGDVIVSMTKEVASGVKANTIILNVASSSADVAAVQKFISDSANEPITFQIAEGDKRKDIVSTPLTGIVDGKAALGIGLDTVGTLRLPIHKAFYQGALLTADLTKSVAIGLTGFLKNLIFAKADLAQVTGPIGIVGLVGDAIQLGFIYLLSFTAFISINLAIINLLPFPALDGGRILFVIIEAIKGSPIKPKVANTLNTIGFGLLILLMLVITFHDIFNVIW
jgi:regulator of sigma E protease